MNSKFLFFILLLPVCASCKKDKEPYPMVDTSNYPVYNAVKNMFSLMGNATKNPELLHGKSFANAFAEIIATRNESPSNKNSADSCLARLFLRPQEMEGGSQGNCIETLLKISEEMNQQSKSKFVIMGNTWGEREYFVRLGQAFDSKGLGYALLVYIGGRAKVFFTDNNSRNKILVDEEGNEYDREDFLNLVKSCSQFECAVIPILDLCLKENFTFVHLGGYFGKGQLGLPMFLSLLGSRVFEKRRRQDEATEQQKEENRKNPRTPAKQPQIANCPIYLYANDRDPALNFNLAGEVSTINMVELFPYLQPLENLTFYVNWLAEMIMLRTFHYSMDYCNQDEQNFIVFANRPSQKLEPILSSKTRWPFQSCLDSLVLKLKGVQTVGKASLAEDGLVGICNKHRENCEKRFELINEIENLEKDLKSLHGATPIDLNAKRTKEGEIRNKKTELKQLFLFDVPPGKRVVVQYVVVADKTFPDNTIKAMDEKNNENFELKIFAASPSVTIFYFVDAKNELVQGNAS
ncbi:MAG: hypothetical protein LBD32_02830 [Cytophagales bacterium]|nr:hypothetical protein [Cytophagales bacterium]